MVSLTGVAEEGGADIRRADDTVPLQSALTRLVRANVCSDEQLYDYGLSQALRAVFCAVHDGARTTSWATTSRGVAAALDQTATTTLAAPGNVAALYHMCHLALTSLPALRCMIYLSTRLLCDAATSYGRGNERPCCTTAWIEALLSFGDEAAFAARYGEHVDKSARYPAWVRACGVDRRYQLGYLLLAGHTLRLVAGGAMGGRHVFGDLVALAVGWTERVLPRVAQMVADHVDSDQSAATPSSSQKHVVTTRLRSEANSFLLHAFYWLCTDVLTLHSDDDGGGGSSKRSSSGDTPARQPPRVLDRDAPQRLWAALPLVRNALRRGLAWIEQQVIAATRNNVQSTDAAQVERALQLVRDVSAHIEQVVSALLRQQEELSAARLAAIQRYGAQARDVHRMDEMLWGQTLCMCLLLRHLTGAWLHVHGGLELERLAGDTSDGCEVLRSEQDVLIYIATSLLALPDRTATTSEDELLVFRATDTLLTALLTVVLAAPLPALQARLWASDERVTAQVHAVLVQRALHFRDERVLRLAAQLSGNILYAAQEDISTTTSISNSSSSNGTKTYGALAAESAEQLLEMLPQSRDAAAHCVVEMLTKAVLARPHSLLPRLFHLLEHGDRQARRNALDILAGLPRLVTSGKGASSTQREVLRLLAEQLLLRVRDEELCVRLQSAALFAKVWPEDVLTPLLHLYLQRDDTGRKQAAAMDSLRTVLASHTDSADVVLLLWQEGLQVYMEIMKTSTAVGVAENATQGSGAGQVRRHVPTTPGDILTHALLYSSEALGESAHDGADSQNNIAAVATSDVQDGEGNMAANDATQTRRVRKPERVLALVQSLSEHWADQVRCCDAAQHVTPLLLHALAMTSNDAAPPHQPPSPLLQTQQWYTACLTRFFASLSKACAQDKELALLNALRTVVFGACEHARQDSEDAVPWLTWLSQADAVYKVLLPLLCLRVCHRHLLSFDATIAHGDGEDTKDGAKATCLRDMASVLWHAALEQRMARIFVTYPEVQRTLLEVLCRLPAHVFVSHMGLTAYDETGAVDTSKTAAPSHDGEAAASRLFRVRVLLFGMSAYIMQTPQVFQQQQRDTNSTAAPLAELQLVLAQTPRVLSVIRTEVLPWLAQEGTDAEQATLQKIARMSMDVMAQLLLVKLAGHLPDTLQAQFAVYTMQPLHDMAAAYRGSDADVAQGQTDVTIRLQYCLHVQQRMLELLPHVAAGSDMLLLAWLTQYLPPLLELANAAVRRISSTTAALDVVHRCYELLFRAVMLSSKLCPVSSSPTNATDQAALPNVDLQRALPTSGPSSSPSSSATHAALLQRLCYEDKAALVRFALGGTRYGAAPSVQQGAVRLLSALLGAAPELFVELTGESDTQATLLSEALMALQSVALIHVDPATRTLAERVVQTITHMAQ